MSPTIHEIDCKKNDMKPDRKKVYTKMSSNIRRRTWQWKMHRNKLYQKLASTRKHSNNRSSAPFFGCTSLVILARALDQNICHRFVRKPKTLSQQHPVNTLMLKSGEPPRIYNKTLQIVANHGANNLSTGTGLQPQ